MFQAHHAPVAHSPTIHLTTCTSAAPLTMVSAQPWSSQHASTRQDPQLIQRSTRLRQRLPTVRVEQSQVEQERPHASRVPRSAARSVLATKLWTSSEGTL